MNYRTSLLGLLSLGVPLLSAQVGSGPAGHTNSLGTTFRPISGHPIMMGVWETRVLEFEAYRQANSLPEEEKLYFQQTPEHPVINISLDEAKAFAEWLTKTERDSGKLNDRQRYRLPSNDEWGAAAGLLVGATLTAGQTEARIADEKAFPWGAAWPPPRGAGNYASDEIAGYVDPFPHTSPVGQFAPNRFGLHDMGGNVWEWCEDDDEARRVSKRKGTLRGGSWVYFRREALLTSYEYEVDADLEAPTFGFRLVFEDDDRSDKHFADLRDQKDGMVVDRSQALLGREEEMDDAARLAAERARFLAPRGAGGTGDDDLEVQILENVRLPRAGAPYKNVIGMDFLPLGRNVLLSVYETRVREMDFFMAREQLKRFKKPSFEQKRNHAAASVTYAEAEAFCRWLTNFERARGNLTGTQKYRLPTDSEWSRVAGLGVEPLGTPEERHLKVAETYPWGGEWPPPALSGNYNDTRLNSRDRYANTSPVGNYTPLPNGFHDISGNVAEWVSDSWNGGSDKVARGGSWIDGEKDRLNASYRRRLDPGRALPDVGFRVVLDL